MDQPPRPPGEAERWEMLLRHRERAVATVLRATGVLAEAEDCVQEATLRLVRRPDLDPVRVRALLTRAALHIAIDHLRSLRRRDRVVVRLAGGAMSQVVSPEDVLADQAEADRVLSALAALPPREREVMLLRLRGYSVAEAAKLLGLSYKSVEGAITRARSRMRSKLGALLGWLGRNLGRLGDTPQGDAAALLALLFFGHSLLFGNGGWPTPGGGHDTHHGGTVADALLQGTAPAPAGRHAGGAPAEAGRAGGGRGGTPPGGGGGEHQTKVLINTGPVYVHGPQPGGPPLINGGPLIITWGGPSDLHPIGRAEAVVHCALTEPLWQQVFGTYLC